MFQRLCIAQLSFRIVQIAPPVLATWYCHRYLIARLLELRGRIEAPVLEKSVLPALLTGSSYAATGFCAAAAMVALLNWIRSVRMNQEDVPHKQRLLPVVIGLAYVASLTHAIVVATSTTVAMMHVDSERRIYAEKAAFGGLLTAESEDDAYFRIEPALVVENVSELENPDDLFVFYMDLILDGNTSPAVARHMVGPLIQLLLAEEKAGTGWDEFRTLPLTNSCVTRIGELSEQSFTAPFETSDLISIRAEPHGIDIPSLVSNKSETIAQLVAWWETVSDKPEWTPLPLYEPNH